MGRPSKYTPRRSVGRGAGGVEQTQDCQPGMPGARVSETWFSRWREAALAGIGLGLSGRRRPRRGSWRRSGPTRSRCWAEFDEAMAKLERGEGAASSVPSSDSIWPGPRHSNPTWRGFAPHFHDGLDRQVYSAVSFTHLIEQSCPRGWITSGKRGEG
jgi:hypothetical protein